MSKLDLIKKLAKLGTVAGTASLLSQEDAQAAGISTIAKKLGITLEKAAEIKKLAQTVPPDVFEKNIQAIQKVSEHLKNPQQGSKRLGQGVDAMVYDAGDSVVKEPRLGTLGKSWNSERNTIIPSIMEETGYGPKTKTVQTSFNRYQVQDKLSPLDDLNKHPKLSGDEILNDLEQKEIDMLYNDKGVYKGTDLSQTEKETLKNIRQQIDERRTQILKEMGVPDDIMSRGNIIDDAELEDYLKEHKLEKLQGIVNPSDLHQGNVGIDASGNIKVFDTGNFMSLDKSKMTPEMKKKVLENYIAFPNKKTELQAALNNSTNLNNIKKAAAIAPLATPTPDSMLNQSVQDLKNAYTTIRKPIIDTTRMVGEKLADAVRLSPNLTEEQKQQERDIAGTISEMALDPINLLSPGLGAAVMAADVVTQQSPEEIQKNEKLKALGKLK